MQIANNNQVEDWIATGRAQRINFSGKTLELKYFLKTETILKSFLTTKTNVLNNIQNIKKQLKFSKVICRFYFGDYEPSETLQKQLIDFQKGVFDEITVQIIKDEFGVFKRVLTYAITSGKDVSTLVDIGLETALLSQIDAHLISIRPANTRWIARKISSYIDRYRLVSTDMQEAGIDYHATSCQKRCSTKHRNFENIDMSIVLKKAFGFKGCCLDYRPSPKSKKTGKKKGFPVGMDKFDVASYEWKTVKNQGYQSSRLSDYFNLDRANISNQAISQRPRFNQLLQYLRTL